MLASVNSAVLEGVDGRVVTVEVHVSRGLPGYTVVGLPDAAGRESRERVRAALLSSGLEYPMKRVTVNLAPASVRKAGSGLELAVALALTSADGGLPAGRARRRRRARRARPRRRGAAGRRERSRSSTPIARAGAECVIVPAANAAEAALVPGVHVRVARTLGELHACLKGEAPWPDPPDPAPSVRRRRARRAARPRRRARARQRPSRAGGRRGRRHTTSCSSGRPASARRCSPAGCRRSCPRSIATPRSRSPASTPRPGAAAISALHDPAAVPRAAPQRVDASRSSAAAARACARARSRSRTAACCSSTSSPSSRRSVLEALRQPLEERAIRISRASGTLEFPADFLLVACANPCPCGRIEKECRCTDVHRTRYARRLSAPLLDRFDLRLRIETPGTEVGASSAGSPHAGSRSRSNDNDPGSPERIGAATRTSRPARSKRSCRSPPTRARRGSTRAASAGSPGAAPRASDGSRARSPTSTTATRCTADDVVRASWLREDVW